MDFEDHWSVGWSVGWSVDWSVDWSIRRSLGVPSPFPRTSCGSLRTPWPPQRPPPDAHEDLLGPPGTSKHHPENDFVRNLKVRFL